MNLAYIGPGPGLAVPAGGLAFLFAILVALFLTVSFPLRRLLWRPKPRGVSLFQRAIVLGLDGLEPSLVEQGMREGWLPHFRQLAERGSYQTLGTTSPPLSPVAWSTFATGVNPGKHGIFDFVHRSGQMGLKLSMASTENHQPRFRRKSRSFWSILGEYGVFTHVLRVPVSWPPEQFSGVQLAAMALPDLRGTQGTYTLVSHEPQPTPQGHWLAWETSSSIHSATLRLEQFGSLKLTLHPDHVLSWPGHREQLKPLTWTGWRSLPLGRVLGLAQFCLLSAAGELPRLYISPIQIHPRAPVWPVSHPAPYAAALARLVGDYATCGLAEDTNALEDGVLTQELFLQQSLEIHAQRKAQFFQMLRRTGPSGACVAVFDGSDRISHMAFQDDEVMRNLYQEMDRLVGETLEQIGPNDLFVVLSDHGFHSIHGCVDLNFWLSEQGLLVADHQGQVDWAQTKAIFLGLNGLHLNRRGREPHGILTDQEATQLGRELCQQIPALRDPQRDSPLVAKVFLAEEIYQGPYRDYGPDLVVAFEKGYRSLKAASHGKKSGQLLWPNPTRWCADHCFLPSQVPGVLFSNQSLTNPAHLRDLAPTLLEAFGVEAPPHMEGHSLLPKGTAQ